MSLPCQAEAIGSYSLLKITLTVAEVHPQDHLYCTQSPPAEDQYQVFPCKIIFGRS